MKINKPKLSFWQIWNMNVGFFGIQYSFGLQQTAINPIFEFLGAGHSDLPLLNLAGPMTGLLIQPIIGVVSDKTWSPKFGRRKPFFFIGALMASICLFVFPYSPQLWFAVGLLWLLDVANNTAMEPYRAFVGDKLPDDQLTFGYQMQSLFVGAGITIANFSILIFQTILSDEEKSNTLCSNPTGIPEWAYYAFFLGAIASIGTVAWSAYKTSEIPPSEEELKEIEEFNDDKPSPLIQILTALIVIISVPILLGLGIAYLVPYLFENYNLLVILMLVIAFVWLYFLYRLIKNSPSNSSLKKIGDLVMPIMETSEAIKDMPKFMWRLSAVYFFQWYALFVYWQYITPMLRKSVYNISSSDYERFESIKEMCKTGVEISSADNDFANKIQLLSEQAVGQASLMNGSYNFVTMIVALLLVPFVKKYSSKWVYVVCLSFSAIAMLSMPFITNEYALITPMVLFGIGWAAMMGIPYSMVSKIIPEERRGVYMGILNMMIVIPMLIQTVSFGPIIKNLLNNNPINAIIFGGVFFLASSLLAIRLKESK